MSVSPIHSFSALSHFPLQALQSALFHFPLQALQRVHYSTFLCRHYRECIIPLSFAGITESALHAGSTRRRPVRHQGLAIFATV